MTEPLTLGQRREQLIDIMQDAAKGETKATLRAEIARLTAANKALTVAKDKAEREYLRVWNERDAQRRRAEAAEAKLAKVDAELRDDDQTVEALAKIMHDRSDDDGCSIPWGKQSPRYRSQQRRQVRKVLVALASKEASHAE